jgi:hypothetical protein
MSECRLKSKKKLKEHRSTVKELHNKQLDEFKNEKLEVYKFEDKLKQLKKKLNQLKQKNQEENTFETFEAVQGLNQNIEELERKIQRIKNDENLSEYLLTVYDIFHKNAFNENEKRNLEPIPETTEIPEKNPENTLSTTRAITDLIVCKETNQNGKYLEDYTNAVNHFRAEQAKKEIRMKPVDELTFYGQSQKTVTATKTPLATKKNTCDETGQVCDQCDKPNTLYVHARECLLVCENCGACQVFQDLQQPQWSDECYHVTSYRYKRKSYFIEHLNRFQGKEHTNIPRPVLTSLMNELQARRITKTDEITPQLIKDLLKDIGKTNYYDNVNSIIRILSGRPLPQFSPELQVRLQKMFNETLEPFDKWKYLIPNRSNYLSYPYVIRKLLVIIAERDNDPELKKYVKCFSLLKSKEKLWAQERVWEKICQETGFPFYKSI